MSCAGCVELRLRCVAGAAGLQVQRERTTYVRIFGIEFNVFGVVVVCVLRTRHALGPRHSPALSTSGPLRFPYHPRMLPQA